jgi:hypothetical protein
MGGDGVMKIYKLAKPDTFYIAQLYATTRIEYVPVTDAVPVSVAGMEAFDLFIHRNISIDCYLKRKKFKISEGMTGAEVVTGASEKACIAAAQRNFKILTIRGKQPLSEQVETILGKFGCTPRYVETEEAGK